MAERNEQIDGCVALRMVDHEIAEMKRLYVVLAREGGRAGLCAVEHLIAEARIAGYTKIRLDVLEEFAQERRLLAGCRTPRAS